MRTQSRTVAAIYKGLQGKSWTVWDVWNLNDYSQFYEVELVWSGRGGVVFKSEDMKDVEAYMKSLWAEKVAC